ncbi:hypothetical protein B7R54_12105 [Subtercola boreus]|uniref:Transglutaminase-like domain-containing protein n=1 Tax=Subtercola boreus TaxID=120213 RepID=A0A3E0VIT0_9MICO|nr:DUF3488 and transglutaminase-like domain-containing protein [Subtercola boreus]RFA09862.1 hypothetical protein B7R54_12105 [Subtercola boreus]TQL53010.1 transglutaminase superfamily protein [Subtercola boreus]
MSGTRIRPSSRRPGGSRLTGRRGSSDEFTRAWAGFDEARATPAGTTPRGPVHSDGVGRADDHDRLTRTEPGRAGQAAVSPILFLLIMLPVGGLAPLLSGSGWWWNTALVVALVLGAALLVRLLPLPAAAPPIAALVAWAITVTVMFAPGDALFGFLPTLGTLDTIRSGLADAGESIALQSVPADPVQPIVLLLALTVGLLAVLADSLVFGLRMPALAGLVPVSILVVPYTVRQQEFDIVLFVVLAATYLLLLFAAGRFGIGLRLRQGENIRAGRNAGRAVLSGALAVLLACFLPGVTPGLTPGSFRPAQSAQLPSVYSSGVDPSIQLSQDLRRTNPVLSLTYSTTSASGLYLKLVNLSDFTTSPWQPEDLSEAAPLGSGFAAPDGLSADVAIQPVTTDVSVTGLRSDWLPVPYPETDVTGLDGDWTVSPGSLTVTGDNTNTTGQDYSVTSLLVQPTPAQLAASASTVPDALQNYLRLPRSISPIIRNTALEVTGSAASNYDKAVALQSYFTSGAFEYSVSAPVEGHYDGGNFAAVATFLSAKSGYCIHFASAMAVMARTLGIPSRIAIGYHPGGAGTRESDDLTTFQVYSDQLHAWPELWFDGIGWLAFEPTPGLGLTPPEYSLPNYTGAAATAPLRDGATSSAVPTTPRAAPQLDSGDVATSDPQVQAAQQGRAWLIAAGIAVLVILLALVPAGWRRLRRRRRLAAMMVDDRPASIGWQEVRDSAKDYRFELLDGETARGFAARLGSLYHMPAEPIEELLVAVEREQFARPGTAGQPDRLVSDVEQIIRALSAQASTADDRRALLLPTSLLGRPGR